MRAPLWDITEAFRAFLFPPLCLSCAAPLPSTTLMLCPACRRRAIPLAESDPLLHAGLARLSSDGACDGIVSCYRFVLDGPLQSLLHALKYEGMRSLGRRLGREVGSRVLDAAWSGSLRSVVPVPLHRVKLRERGYNQAEVIAAGVSDVTGLPVLPRQLRRIRSTRSQTTLTAAERLRNVDQAFEAGPACGSQSRGILLVDDVITTGATIRACAKALRSRGVPAVYAASVALAE